MIGAKNIYAKEFIEMQLDVPRMGANLDRWIYVNYLVDFITNMNNWIVQTKRHGVNILDFWSMHVCPYFYVMNIVMKVEIICCTLCFIQMKVNDGDSPFYTQFLKKKWMRYKIEQVHKS